MIFYKSCTQLKWNTKTCTCYSLGTLITVAKDAIETPPLVTDKTIKDLLK